MAVASALERKTSMALGLLQLEANDAKSSTLDAPDPAQKYSCSEEKEMAVVKQMAMALCCRNDRLVENHVQAIPLLKN